MSTRRSNTDGRVARGERTRDALVEAHAELLREGVLKPTGKALADRAGVSLRTLWLNFGDREGLLKATTAYWDSADKALYEPVDPTLPQADRIERYCAQRSIRLEQLAPAARSAILGEPFSEALSASRRLHVDRLESDIAAAFGPELEASGSQRSALATALFIASSSSAWATMRDDFSLDVDAATAVMKFTVQTLLAP